MLGERAGGDLAGHPRVAEDVALLEQSREDSEVGAEMVDPERGVDHDHCTSGGASRAWPRPGSLPPRRTRRGALSRSINALSASRISAAWGKCRSLPPLG